MLRIGEVVVAVRTFGRMRLTLELPVRAGPSEVWAAVCTVADTNRELAPFMRMTDSTHGAPFDADAWRIGTPVSWQLLFGVVPIDRHRIELEALPERRGFRESSSSWWYRVWSHERALLDDPGGCIVRDSVHIEARFGAPDRVIEWAVRWTFRRRHRYLSRRFG